MKANEANRRRDVVAEGQEDATAEFARRLLGVRRLREAMIGPQFFSDPAWDMLLDLYVQSEMGKEVSISSLCLSSAAPMSTALRWINSMIDAGLLARRSDPKDGRRVFVAFGEGAEESLRIFLTRAMAELGNLPEASSL